MSDSVLWRALSGGPPITAVGVTWLSDEVRAVLPEGGGPGGLAAFAVGAGAQFVFVDAGADHALQEARALRQHAIEPVWVVGGPLGSVAAELGWDRVIRASASGFASLQTEIEEATRTALARVAVGLRGGLRVHVIADDLASDVGWLVDPAAVSVLMPHYRRLAGAVTGGGGRAIFHSDGDLRTVCPQLVRCGFVALHVGAVPSGSLRAVLRGVRTCGLIPAGGIPAAAAETSVEELARLCAEVALEGAFVLCDDGGLMTSEQLTRVTEVQRMVRTLAAEGPVPR
ncbi:MAG: hypothetical protein U1E26_09445 [Coriobacteriia bacterium]|nr:hypothetical protein [Coriobacteriia bacterium]